MGSSDWTASMRIALIWTVLIRADSPDMASFDADSPDADRWQFIRRSWKGKVIEMKNRKWIAVLACAAMLVTAFSGCGKGNEEPGSDSNTPAPTQAQATKAPTTAPTEAPKAQAEELPEAKYYFSFDKADGTAGIQATGQNKTGDPILYDNGKEIVFIPGVKGDAVYTDGSYGYKLTDVNGVGDTYTVSFWVYATRFANYMPSVQFGPDVHGDVTGSQHYLNITRAEWIGAGAYPCIWSYDQASDAYWPNWSPDEADERLKQWLNITLVVDAGKSTVDGVGILADLYLNGELFGKEIPVARGTMAASDNFDFLLGVNYWDAIFKGGFDELYIFDKALTAGQALALYQKGDAKAAFDEPEHIFVVTPNSKAIDTIGSDKFDNALGSKYFAPIQIKDGETYEIKMANWSDGQDSKNNYAMVFTSAESANPLTDKNRVATVYADADGDGTFNYTWGNWKTWSSKVMRDADVTIKITRDGNELSIQADNVDYNESANTMYAKVDVSKAGESVYLYITAQKSYVELLSVKDKTPKSTTGTIVGNTNCVVPFWSVFSDIWAVPAGTSKTVHFTNYTDGANNWDNFVVILQTTPTGHSADTEGYAEYAVFRADNFGWGDGYAATTATCDWNWDTFTSDMDGAKVDLTVTNNGTTADVVAVVTTTAGTVYTQSYTGTPINGDLYFCLTLENAYLVFEPVIVGKTDCVVPFWSAFSDIWTVPEGEAKTVRFKNYTDGVNNWDNFVVILQTTPTGHSADTEGYAEYAVFRADNFGWGDGYAATTATCDWNWDTFTSDMDGATVALTVTNNGTTADVVAYVTTADGKNYRQAYEGVPINGPLNFCLTLENAYLVFEDTVVGNTDCVVQFWSAFSDIVKVPEGKSRTINFTNYTDGVNNWDNFVVILQTTPTGHSADTEGYAEYAVFRADNYGWGDGYAATTATCDWNWDTFKDDMDGAEVALTVTNHGTTADVVAVVTTKAGTVYTQSYTGTPINGDLYFCLTLENAYLVLK